VQKIAATNRQLFFEHLKPGFSRVQMEALSGLKSLGVLEQGLMRHFVAAKRELRSRADAPRTRGQVLPDSRVQACRRWLEGKSLCSNDMVSDGVLNQLGVAFGVQDFHDLVLVEGNGVRGYIQRIRYLLHRLSFG
jgi:hypothetical protein